MRRLRLPGLLELVIYSILSFPNRQCYNFLKFRWKFLISLSMLTNSRNRFARFELLLILNNIVISNVPNNCKSPVSELHGLLLPSS